MPKCNFNKVACTFIEITLRHGWSPINLLHIFRTPFTKNASEWLLYIYVHLRKSIWTVVWWKQSFLCWLLRSCRYLLVTKICFSNSAPISFRKLLLHSFILKLYIHCFKKSLQFWRNAMRFILKAKNLFWYSDSALGTFEWRLFCVILWRILSIINFYIF